MSGKDWWRSPFERVSHQLLTMTSAMTKREMSHEYTVWSFEYAHCIRDEKLPQKNWFDQLSSSPVSKIHSEKVFCVFLENQFFTRDSFCGTDFDMKKWSDRAEIFTRGGHNACPGVFFFVFNFNLSVKSYEDFRVKNQDLWRTLPYFHDKNWRVKDFFKQKKTPRRKRYDQLW